MTDIVSEFGKNTDFSKEDIVISHDPFEETSTYILNPHNLITFWSDSDTQKATGSYSLSNTKYYWNQIGVGRVINSRKNTDIIALIFHSTILKGDDYVLNKDKYIVKKIYFNCDGENITFERINVSGTEFFHLHDDFITFPNAFSPIKDAALSRFKKREKNEISSSWSMLLPDYLLTNGKIDPSKYTNIAPDTLKKIADAENLEVRVLKTERTEDRSLELKQDLKDEDEVKIVDTFKYFYHYTVKEIYPDIQKMDIYKKNSKQVSTNETEKTIEEEELADAPIEWNRFLFLGLVLLSIYMIYIGSSYGSLFYIFTGIVTLLIASVKYLNSIK